MGVPVPWYIACKQFAAHITLHTRTSMHRVQLLDRALVSRLITLTTNFYRGKDSSFCTSNNILWGHRPPLGSRVYPAATILHRKCIRAMPQPINLPCLLSGSRILLSLLSSVRNFFLYRKFKGCVRYIELKY